MLAARVHMMGLGVLSGCLLAGSASALGLAELTDREAASGIKCALDQGAAVAVAKLGGDASIEEYVTRKALDGLYLVIGEQELAIREHPAAAAGAIAAKVFGALR